MTTELKKVSTIAQINVKGTDGELPIAPVTLLFLSNALMRMAMPNAAVVNAILINRKSLNLQLLVLGRQAWLKGRTKGT